MTQLLCYATPMLSLKKINEKKTIQNKNKDGIIDYHQSYNHTHIGIAFFLCRRRTKRNMETIYDEIEIEDFTFDPVQQIFQYPCPCGDRFAISLYDMQEGEDIAVCPSCSLMVKVIFEPEDLEEYLEG